MAKDEALEIFNEWADEDTHRAANVKVDPFAVLAQRNQAEAEEEKARIARALAKISGPTPRPARVKSKKSGRSVSEQSRGRKKSPYTLLLERALHEIKPGMPDGGTLEEWCDRLKDKEIKFPIPSTDRQASRFIEYPDALHDHRYRNAVRMQIRKIVGNKLRAKS